MKKFQYKAAAAVLVLLLLSVSGVYWLSVKSPTKPALDGSFQTLSIDVNGLRRNYSLYVPARISQQAPLVIVLHGSKGDGQQARKVYSFLFDQLADEHGFIVVYPDGYERHWNGCRTDGPYAANRLAIDDVGFLQTLQQRIRKTYGLDSGKTLFTGLSNGGHMVLRMALERPDSAAVYVPVIANMPAATNMGCNEAKESVAIAFMNGTLDPLNPYEGGEVALYGHFLPRGEVLSTEDSVAYWLNLANLGRYPSRSWEIDNSDRDDSKISVKQWSGEGKPLIGLYTVLGGGHTLPSTTARLPRILGVTNQDADAAELIWQFYSDSTVRNP